MTMTEIDKKAYAVVREHLLKQMAKSEIVNDEDGDVRCAYRGPRGLKCAVGVLISDEVFDPVSNSAPVRSTAIEAMLRASGWGDISPLLLSNLQDVHDTRELSEWERLLPEDPEEFKP